MNIILVMVQSLNGKITKGDDPHITNWTSKEDHDFFVDMLEKHDLIVMGSGTYDAVRDVIKPDRKTRRIILTSDPKRYEKDVIAGKIEFSSESANDLVKRLEEEGYEKMLLVGGGETNTNFFENGLINEFYLTLEPRMFGKGKPIVGDGDFDLSLILTSFKKLNFNGTLLLHYQVLR